MLGRPGQGDNLIISQSLGHMLLSIRRSPAPVPERNHGALPGPDDTFRCWITRKLNSFHEELEEEEMHGGSPTVFGRKMGLVDLTSGAIPYLCISKSKHGSEYKSIEIVSLDESMNKRNA